MSTLKRQLAVLVTAVLIAAGLVAGPSAVAAPYPGTVGTDAGAAALPAPPRQARVRVDIDGESGRPKGKLVFTLIRKPGNRTFEFRRTYDGRPDTFTLAGLRPGRYVVVVSYVPDDDSKWKPSTTRARTRVRG